MEDNLPKKHSALPRDYTLSLAPERTILKRKSGEELSYHSGHVVKKERIEKTHTMEEQNVDMLIQPDSDCESNYKDLEARSQALLNAVRSRKRSTQPRVRKKPKKTWCCQCEALGEFTHLRCQCGHVTSDCGLCEHFDYEDRCTC